MSENYIKSKEFLSTIYKLEKLMLNADYGRAFSIREYIITIGKQEDAYEWFSLYNTQREIRYEVYYQKSAQNFSINELYKWSDEENITLKDSQIESRAGIRILNEIKEIVEHIITLQTDRTLQV